MKHGQYPPHPILSDYVKCLWTSERDFQPPDDTLESLPDIYIELVFAFGSRVQIDDGQLRRDLPRGYIIGLLDQPLRLSAHGVVKVVAARFFAWGFRPLFHFDLQPLPNAVHQLDTTWRHLTNHLEQAVLQDDDEAAIDLLHDFLIERALNVRFEQKEIQAAAQWLLSQKGQVKISELADYCSYSSRQLERKFKRSVGVSP
jgi:AraC-like DNA-binding protein